MKIRELYKGCSFDVLFSNVEVCVVTWRCESGLCTTTKYSHLDYIHDELRWWKVHVSPSFYIVHAMGRNENDNK